MKKIVVFLFLLLASNGFSAGIGDIIPIPTPKPTLTPVPSSTPIPHPTTIPIDPPVLVPTENGTVLLIKSILLRPDGVCFVVVFPTQP